MNPRDEWGRGYWTGILLVTAYAAIFWKAPPAVWVWPACMVVRLYWLVRQKGQS